MAAAKRVLSARTVVEAWASSGTCDMASEKVPRSRFGLLAREEGPIEKTLVGYVIYHMLECSASVTSRARVASFFRFHRGRCSAYGNAGGQSNNR